MSANPFDRLPNASPEHERIVLSCMMQDPANCIPVVIESIGPDAFRGGGHRVIVEAILERFHQHQGCNLIGVQQHLIDMGRIEDAGGVGNLTEIAMAAPTVMDMPRALDEVRRKWALTRIWQTGYDAVQLAANHQDEGNPDQLLDDVETAFFNLRATFAKQDELLKPAKEFINQAIDQFEHAYKARGTGVLGVPSGFVDLDRMCNGFKGGQLIVLAARPSMGKSALAMNILQHAAEQGHGSALFSLEMSGMEMAQRMICASADVSLQRVRDGFLSKQDFPRITTAGSRVSQQNIWIDETPSLSLYALRARARRLKLQHKIGLIVIDYLQLMRCPSKRGDANRALEIADITGGLKTLAKELDIPIISLAQLNREAERRGEPKLSDLRESGSIEQDADVVLLLNRNKEDPAEPSKLFVAKQRNGPVGPIDLMFDGEKTRFRDCTDRKYSNSEEHRQKGYTKKAA
jgi:replicative DNA helicase